MKRPSFQFYPGDWLRDLALRACSISARGLWIDMLALMHQAEPYGWLVLNGVPITTEQLSRMVGGSEKKVVGWLKELEKAGVFSRTPDGRIYSRRMLRDEDLRMRRAAGGSKGGEFGHLGGEYGARGGRPKGSGEPGSNDGELFKEGGADNPPKNPPSPPPKEPPPSSSSSSSSAEETSKDTSGVDTPGGTHDHESGITYSAEFIAAWAEYPKRAGGRDKVGAWKAWNARLAAGETAEDMTAGIKRYAAYMRATGKEGTEYVKMMSTFVGPRFHFREPYDIPPPGSSPTPIRPAQKASLAEKSAKAEAEALLRFGPARLDS